MMPENRKDRRFLRLFLATVVGTPALITCLSALIAILVGEPPGISEAGFFLLLSLVYSTGAGLIGYLPMRLCWRGMFGWLKARGITDRHAALLAVAPLSILAALALGLILLAMIGFGSPEWNGSPGDSAAFLLKGIFILSLPTYVVAACSGWWIFSPARSSELPR